MSCQENISPAELYASYFEIKEPKFYTRLPNILSDLTYDLVDEKTGKSTIMKLTPFDKELYRVLKETAGDHGKCWRRTEDLADLCGMSVGQVVKSKEVLQEKFHQLDGKSLIDIKKKPKSIIKDGVVVGKTIYHETMIVDIWQYNNAHMATRKYLKTKIPIEDEADSPHEGAGGADSPHESAAQGAPSPGERYNKNAVKKKSLSKEQQPTANAVSVVSSNLKPFLYPSDGHSKAYQWLIKHGFDERSAMSIVGDPKFSVADMEKACEYFIKHINIKKQKKEEFTNILGYFIDVLNKKYWKK